jgi:branched-chain amino acid transport system substrate-binding protein
MNSSIRGSCLVTAAVLFAAVAAGAQAKADETIEFGLSVPLSGSGAVFGKGVEWMCKKAAQEIKDSGGIKVKDKVYNINCVAYDNKYTAAEATKVAHTLLDRDGTKYVFAFGTAPVLATQSMTERQGVLMLHTAWGKNVKGPQFPLSFGTNNSAFELMPIMVNYITKTYPNAKTIVLANANDATGHETESVARPTWEKAGIKVLASDFYERGTTEFQPIAARIMSFNPDIVDLSSVLPADAGRVFKELDVLGYKGIKISDNGSGVDALSATGGTAANNVYMALAMPFDGPSATDYQRKVNEEARAYLGESLNFGTIPGYDAVQIIKAGMEKAQSVDPKDVGAVLPTEKFKTFLGGEIGFGGKTTYGYPQAPNLPVYITQIVDGKLVERLRVDRSTNTN